MLSHTSRARTALQLLLAAVPATALALACADRSAPVAPRARARAATVAAAAEGTRYGATVPVGAGVARTYVTLENGAPVELGVELSDRALDGLPAAGGHDGAHPRDHAEEHMYELPLPAEAGATAYRSVNVGWMPDGHGAPYDRPHFDFHFYTIPTAERLAIDPADPQWAEKAASLPDAAFVPARYAPLSALIGKPAPAVTVPRMGLHWLDVASPELHGAPFTHTFFYGSWNGALIFAEPMITRALLESRATVDVPLPAAARYAPAGLHARAYRVSWDDARQRHRVALVQLTAQR